MAKLSKKTIIKALRERGIEAEFKDIDKGNGLIKEGLVLHGYTSNSERKSIAPILYFNREIESLANI